MKLIVKRERGKERRREREREKEMKFWDWEQTKNGDESGDKEREKGDWEEVGKDEWLQRWKRGEKEMRLKALLKIETRMTGESRQREREREGGDSLSKWQRERWRERKERVRGVKRTSRQLQPERKRVLARLKKPGRPLKTIRLMKYVKAHKETPRPFRKEGWVEIWSRKLGKILCISKNEKHAKALSIRTS